MITTEEDLSCSLWKFKL